MYRGLRAEVHDVVVVGYPSYPPHLTTRPTATLGTAKMQQTNIPAPLVLRHSCMLNHESTCGRMGHRVLHDATTHVPSRENAVHRPHCSSDSPQWCGAARPDSNATPRGSTDAILLTSASVHPGSSGGPVISLATGKLLGESHEQLMFMHMYVDILNAKRATDISVYITCCETVVACASNRYRDKLFAVLR